VEAIVVTFQWLSSSGIDGTPTVFAVCADKETACAHIEWTFRLSPGHIDRNAVRIDLPDGSFTNRFRFETHEYRTSPN
jgi:hypothetical protein